MAQFNLHIETKEPFAFLESEFGFEKIVSNASRVRYEGHSVFVEILFDNNRSYELSLLIGIKRSDEMAFSIGEVLRFYDHPHATSFSLVQVTTNEGLTFWLHKMACGLRDYSEDLLKECKEGFAGLLRQREKEVNEYALKRSLDEAREKASLAWKCKDYAMVVKVLTPLRASLTSSEVGKLDFANGKLRGKRNIS